GSVDPTSGTATMLEITRVLGEMAKNGFRPRRTLMFCSWGAEEYGLIGSIEYVEEYVKVFGARIISYLNVDIAVQGNHTVQIKTSPMLFDIIVEASKLWNNVTNEPKIAYGLGSGSDFFSFDQLVGSSNMDGRYTFDHTYYESLGSYPLYHTSYEVFSMMKNFIDPNFTAHRTMGQLMGVVALFLSETPVLQFNVSRYT
ncbi:unnamed protein product, partial [Rotaria socialis]